MHFRTASAAGTTSVGPPGPNRKPVVLPHTRSAATLEVVTVTARTPRGSSASCRKHASRPSTFYAPRSSAFPAFDHGRTLDRCTRTTDRRDQRSRFLTRDPIEAVTRSPYSYGENNPVNNTDPLGLFCVGDLCTDGITDAIDDAWDSTGGRAVSWVADNPGTAATIVGVGVCVVDSLGALRRGSRWGVGGPKRRASRGGRLPGLPWREPRRWAHHVRDLRAGLSASVLRSRSWRDAGHPGVLAAGEQGIMAGSSFWQRALVRGFSVTPDLAGLFGGWYFDDGC